ncbi:hypothetical protein [Pleomorphomonas sp. PLEO]|uniref:hypothetical protein n=1 Tax=Pleomorphomonas sp. PLEO TaxID=3239306 RepID=UPI00351EDAB9
MSDKSLFLFLRPDIAKTECLLAKAAAAKIGVDAISLSKAAGGGWDEPLMIDSTLAPHLAVAP